VSNVQNQRKASWGKVGESLRIYLTKATKGWCGNFSDIDKNWRTS